MVEGLLAFPLVKEHANTFIMIKQKWPEEIFLRQKKMILEVKEEGENMRVGRSIEKHSSSTTVGGVIDLQQNAQMPSPLDHLKQLSEERLYH